MNMAKKRNTRKIAIKNENENPRVPSKCVCTTENTWKDFRLSRLTLEEESWVFILILRKIMKYMHNILPFAGAKG